MRMESDKQYCTKFGPHRIKLDNNKVTGKVTLCLKTDLSNHYCTVVAIDTICLCGTGRDIISISLFFIQYIRNLNCVRLPEVQQYFLYTIGFRGCRVLF